MLHVRELIWNEWNEEHIARHGIETDEVEEVVRGRPYVVRGRGDTYGVIGQTSAGRYLTVILAPRGNDTYYVITARPADEGERRLYRRTRGMR